MPEQMINPEMIEIMRRLAEPIDRDAVQRTNARDTRKGYDTTGFGYQFIVNRLNEVLGTQWGFRCSTLNSTVGKYQSGTEYVDVTVDVGVWVLDDTRTRNAPGGHRSSSYADALKGAMTNGLKKAAALWGVGREAYEGTIDDDNVPSDDMPLKTQPRYDAPRQQPNPQPAPKQQQMQAPVQMSDQDIPRNEPLPPRQSGAPQSRPVTKGQYDILMMSVKRNKMPEDTFNLYIAAKYGVSDPKELKQKDLNAILEYLEIWQTQAVTTEAEEDFPEFDEAAPKPQQETASLAIDSLRSQIWADLLMLCNGSTRDAYKELAAISKIPGKFESVTSVGAIQNFDHAHAIVERVQSALAK